MNDFFLLLNTVLPLAASIRPSDVNPCYRSCDLPSIPMTCQFNWTLDWFYTMAEEPVGSILYIDKLLYFKLFPRCVINTLVFCLKEHYRIKRKQRV